MGIFKAIDSARPALTVDEIVKRIQASRLTLTPTPTPTLTLTLTLTLTRQGNHEKLAAKVERKMIAEAEYYKNRYGFDGTKPVTPS